MLTRNFITFCVLAALWSSTSANILTLHGKWGTEMIKCVNEGSDYHKYNYTIPDPIIHILSYDSFDYFTFIKVGGIFELKSTFTDDITYNEWTLNEYNEENGVKTYNGQLGIEGGDGMLISQEAFWNITLTIQPKGPSKLQTHVHAGSWGSVRCASAKALIDTLTIAN